MASPQVEFDEVSIAFATDRNDALRARRISKLIFDYLPELLGDLRHPGGNLEIERVEVPWLRVSFEVLDDEKIARLAAVEIHRALLRALE